MCLKANFERSGYSCCATEIIYQGLIMPVGVWKGWLSSSSHLLTALKRGGIQWNLHKDTDRSRIKDHRKDALTEKSNLIKVLINHCRDKWLMATKSEPCVDQAVIMRHKYMLWMPTISNAIRQMDQSAPDPDQAKSSGSRDQWISVSPTERRRRLGCLSPHASWSLPFECVSISLSLWTFPRLPVCILQL